MFARSGRPASRLSRRPKTHLTHSGTGIASRQTGFARMMDVNRQVVEGCEAALLLTDASGKVVFANDSSARLLGRDLSGARLAADALGDASPLAGSVAAVYRAAAASRQAGHELVACTDEAGSRFFWVTVTPAGRGGPDAGLLVVVADISAPVMEAPAIRKIFSQISHDLRSPLTSIAGAAELLLSGRVGEMEPVQRRLVTIVEEGARKMGEILAKTKADLTRAEAVRGDAGE